jgi:phosphotriesterase-related protein
VGFTLPHEHTACTFWRVPGRWDYWELTDDEELIAPELEVFRDQGGSCVVDVTLPGIGRDAPRLRRLAQRTGLAIVMGTGWYRQSYYPAEAYIDRRSVESLAETMIGEAQLGVDDTGIQPGIIGEIGTDMPWVSAQEERVFRAAARAQRATGMSITTHASLSEVGMLQLTILEEEGADLSRVVVGHVDSRPSLRYCLAILERGASVEFDLLGRTDLPAVLAEPRLVALLLELLDRGYAQQVLLSHDVCHNNHLRAFGGTGYGYLGDTFVPRLRAVGVDPHLIEKMTIENPRRLLTLDAPGAEVAS